MEIQGVRAEVKVGTSPNKKRSGPEFQDGWEEMRGPLTRTVQTGYREDDSVVPASVRSAVEVGGWDGCKDAILDADSGTSNISRPFVSSRHSRSVHIELEKIPLEKIPTSLIG